MSSALDPTGRGAGERGREIDLVFPPEDLGKLLEVVRFVERHTEPGLLLGPDVEQTPLPAEVYRVIRLAVEVMRQGKATVVAPQGLLLTTQEGRRLPRGKPADAREAPRGWSDPVREAEPTSSGAAPRPRRLPEPPPRGAARRAEPADRTGERAGALRGIARRLRDRAEVGETAPRAPQQRVKPSSVCDRPTRSSREPHGPQELPRGVHLRREDEVSRCARRRRDRN